MPASHSLSSLPPLIPHVRYGWGAPPTDWQFFGSGRQALHFLAKALLRQQPSLLFVLPAYTCDTVLQAIEEAGAETAFVDIDDSLDFDLPDLQRLIDRHPIRPLALVATSLFGAPVRNYKSLFPNCTVIEDRAQSWFDANSSSDHQVMSFGPGKQVSGMGGGALTGATSLNAEYQQLPAAGGFLRSLSLSLISEFLLRAGWSLFGERLAQKHHDSSVNALALPIEPQALSRLRSGWISHSLQTGPHASRSAAAADYHARLNQSLRFRIPRGLPYLRYPVKGRLQAPGVSQGDMYQGLWHEAQQRAGRAFPGAAALVGASLLPTHARVTPAHRAAYAALVASTA